MAEKTVQQRLADLEDEILRLEGGQDALLYCIAQMVRRSTAHMSVQEVADLFDSFVVNVDPAIVATWPARKQRAYEHQEQAGKMIAYQLLMMAAGDRGQAQDIPTKPS